MTGSPGALPPAGRLVLPTSANVRYPLPQREEVGRGGGRALHLSLAAHYRNDHLKGDGHASISAALRAAAAAVAAPCP